EGSNPSPKENGGAEAPPFRQLWICVFSTLAEERQHRLVGLSGQRQRRGRQRLAGLQGEQVGTFLVGVGDDEVVGAGLQRVDHGLGGVRRVCTTDSDEPSDEAWLRSVVSAVDSDRFSV